MREQALSRSTHSRDEAVFRERFEKYAPETLQLILRTRTHDAAARTGSTEAFLRDRGGEE